MPINKSLTILLAVCALLLPAKSAHASCSLGAAAVAFGTYNPLSTAPTDTIGSLIYQCNQKAHNIMITLSRGSGTSFATRRMLNGSQQLFYNLYRDSGRSIIWGDGGGGTQAFFIVNPQPNNTDLSLPIFGRIPAGQSVRAGTYADTLTITLTF